MSTANSSSCSVGSWAQGAGVRGVELVLHQPHGGQAVVRITRQRRGRHQETNGQAAPLALRPARGKFLQHRHLAACGAVGTAVKSRLAEVIQDDFIGANNQIGARQLTQLPQFGVGESRLRRAAPPQHGNLLDAAFPQRLQRIVGDVRLGEFLRRSTQNAGDVNRDVADAHNGDAFARKVECQVAVVGVAVVPGDEVRSRMAAYEILARNVHAVVRGSAGREDDLVVEFPQVVEAQVGPVFHVAVVAESRIGSDLVVGCRHRLDLLMVRRHAAAHQPVWRWQPLKHVDLYDQIFLVQQVFGDVKAARACPHNGHPQRRRSRTRLCHSSPLNACLDIAMSLKLQASVRLQPAFRAAIILH